MCRPTRIRNHGFGVHEEIIIQDWRLMNEVDYMRLDAAELD